MEWSRPVIAKEWRPLTAVIDCWVNSTEHSTEQLQCTPSPHMVTLYEVQYEYQCYEKMKLLLRLCLSLAIWQRS